MNEKFTFNQSNNNLSLLKIFTISFVKYVVVITVYIDIESFGEVCAVDNNVESIYIAFNIW